MSVEAVEHGFDWDKSAMYVIERSVWRCVEPGGIVADADRAVWGMLAYSTLELVGG